MNKTLLQCKSVLIAGFIGVLMIMSLSCYAGGQPTSEFLAAALRDQLNASGIEIKFSSNVSSLPSEITNIRYIRIMGVQFIEGRQQGDDIRFSRIWFDTNSSISRVLYSDLDDPQKMLGIIDMKKGNTLLSFGDLPDPIRYNFPTGELVDLIGSGVVSESPESIGGFECWRVNILSKKPGFEDERYDVWLDPSIGFCPRRIEAHMKAGHLIVTQLSDYRELGSGVWYPMTIQWDADNSEKTTSTFVTVSEAKLVSKSSPPNMEVIFPSGTTVEDRVDDVTYDIP